MGSSEEKKRTLCFLDYDHSLPRACVERLAAEWEREGKEGIPAFDGTVLLMPGSFAIREFRSCLSQKFPGGCFPPKLVTPGSFRNSYGGGMDPYLTADREEALLLWVEVLQSASPEEFPFLLSGMEEGDFQEFLSLAGKIQDFRGELDQGGLTLEEALLRAPESDSERRQELFQLEKRYFALAGEHHLEDPYRKKYRQCEELPSLLASGEVELPERIIVAGIPDLSGAVKKLLEIWAEKVPLEIWILSSPGEKALLDPWGAPLPQVWEMRPLPLEEEKIPETIFHGESVREMIHLACAVGCRHGEFSSARTQFIAAGREITPILTEKLREMTGKKNVYDPAGIPLTSLRICRFLASLLELCRQDACSWEDLLSLLRTNEILRLGGSLTELPQNTLLRELDELLQEHLPDSLESALFFASPAWQQIFHTLTDQLEDFRKTPATFLPVLLSRIFPDGDLPAVHGIPFQEEYCAFLPLLKEMGDSLLFSTLDGEKYLELLLAKAGRIALYPPHSEGALEILGFLEITSLPQEELLICGMNNGAIPEKMERSLFMTDSQRELLGLPCDRTRRARDAFYLNFALRHRQKTNGCIRFFASRYTVNGNQVRYSPFLFQGRDDRTLLALADLLFSPGVTVERSVRTGEGIHRSPGLLLPTPPYTPGKNGAPGEGEEAPLVLSVTDFKNYLASPLRFCLSKFRGMVLQDHTVREMDAGHYGTVCHEVLEALSSYEDKGEAQLKKMAPVFLARALEKRYGSPLPLLVETQHDLMLQRLEAACRVLHENAASFRVLEKEYSLGGSPKEGGLGFIPWQGAHLKGRIDRIEISRDGKILRLLDYKTMDGGDAPKESHYKTRSKKFTDLQLPLYKILLQEDPFFRERHKELDFENLTIRCGYFSLPKDVLKTDIQIWEQMDEVLPAAKMLLAEILFHIRESMVKGVFMENPDRKPEYDNFAAVFLPDLSHAVRGCSFVMDKEDE